MAKRDNTKKKSSSATSKARAKKTSAASTTKKRTTKSKAAPKKAAATKKSTKAKATTKAADKKAATSKKTTVKKPQFDALRSLHVLAVAAFGGLIAFIYTLMEPIERSVGISFAADDALRGEGVLAPAVRELFTFDLRHGLTVLLGIAILYSVYVATIGWKKYEQKLASASSVLASRWIFAGVTGAVAVELAAVAVGMYDLLVIKLLAIAILAASYFAYRADKETDQPVKGRYFLAAVVSAAIAIIAVSTFIAVSMVYGAFLSWYVYLALDFLALGLLGYAVNQLFSLRGRKGFTDLKIVERNYAIITLLAGALFVGMIIISTQV